MNLTIEYLRECFDYDPDTGLFTWRERPQHHFPTVLGWKKVNAAWAGKVAGTHRTGGYTTINFAGKMFQAHRLAWFYTHGVWPSKHIDHINGNRSDNRAINLREATNSENMMNASTPRDNKSGVKGVSFHKQKRRWRADVVLRKKQHHLGYFHLLEDAEAAVKEARIRLHGEFANHGDGHEHEVFFE